MKETFTELT